MIFLTVGTSRYPFDRMLSSVDTVLLQKKFTEPLIAQVGPASYKFDYKKTYTYSEIPFEKFLSYLSRARIVITHGGMGTLIQSIQYAKHKPFVFPRRQIFREHVDDHQLFITHYLEKKRLIVTTSLEQYIKNPIYNTKKNTIVSPIVKNLIPYIESL